MQAEYDGIPVEFDENILDDIDVIEMLGELFEDGNIFVVPKIGKAIFGEEQFANIKASLTSDNGRPSMAKLSDMIANVIKDSAAKSRADEKN